MELDKIEKKSIIDLLAMSPELADIEFDPPPSRGKFHRTVDFSE